MTITTVISSDGSIMMLGGNSIQSDFFFDDALLPHEAFDVFVKLVKHAIEQPGVSIALIPDLIKYKTGSL